MKELIYLSDDSPGFRRKGRGKGFEFFDENGKKITDPETIDRISSLGIPPAWKQVWIAPDPRGHIQATGLDDKGRKQYIYHPKWTEYRNAGKFAKMAEFAKALPEIRQRVQKDLRKQGWPRDKVTALVVSLLDESYLRIGNQSYAKENETYGLTTLRRKHMDVNGASVEFHFKAKSGKQQQVKIRKPRLIKLIKECSELPGYEIFKYIDEDGTKSNLSSQDVNAYLHEISDGGFTAKDFRTWGGTVLAVKAYEKTKAEIAANPRKKFTTNLVRNVAKKLGNTVAICREYYIHPCIIEHAENDDLKLEQLQKAADKKYHKLGPQLDIHEKVALFLVERHLKENTSNGKEKLIEIC